MKIVHLCISQSYFDHWGYQENLIPEYQVELEHDVTMISTNKFFPHWLKQEQIDEILSKGKEYYINNVKVIRINACRLLGTHVVFTYNLYKALKKEAPDIIFYHEMTNFAIIICSFYKLLHPKVQYFIDSHNDERNAASTKISEYLYFKFFLTLMHKFIALFVTKYYGVTPSRCNFLLSHYGISKKKMKFLPIGCDTKLANSLPDKNELRKKYNIPLDSFVVVSGGKMGKFKGTEFLVTAVENIRKINTNVVLLLFGTYLDQECENLVKAKNWIVKYGWCDRLTSLELLKLGDVACWPIHHTTLNEDSISVGTPLLIRKTTTTEHLVDGNGLFLFNAGDIEELEKKILKIKEQWGLYKNGAQLIGRKLSYFTIAQTIVDDAMVNLESYRE